MSGIILNSVVAAFGLFPLLYYLLRTGLSHQDNTSVGYLDCILFSVSMMFPISGLSDLSTAQWLTHVVAGIEAVCGVIVLAFIAAYVFRWSIRK